MAPSIHESGKLDTPDNLETNSDDKTGTIGLLWVCFRGEFVRLSDRNGLVTRSGIGLVRAGRNAGDRVGIVWELFSFFWTKKRRWIVPMLLALLLIGTLIVLAQSSAISPFIYTLF